MGLEQKIDPALAASMLDWWRLAGVDTLVDEGPRNWLEAPAAPVRTPAARVQTTPAAPAALPEMLPDTLDAFIAWRLGDAAPEAGWPGARVAPLGMAGAALMVVIDCPERDDAEQLLGGAAGQLFDRMMAAIGRTRADLYLASMAAVAPASGRMPASADPRFATLLRHHVALVAPRRLLVMGNAASRALLGMDALQARGTLRAINHIGGEMTVAPQAVVTFSPRFLLERPAAKAEAWKDLQLLNGGWA
ncbi:uracil-DNA glycosylase family protein [Sphingomonas sp.]|uniref:uracil-DNA glycosylase family protein n=1 Tax=Sphingomonas sp. TaxID=28214 RepID=UPI001D3278CF|nr:uracil-DNA glycosylase family protein [Sphingomonas sp.]MBX9795621.1 uracil-DNA glycosylase [Sphingomonas sp.]